MNLRFCIRLAALFCVVLICQSCSTTAAVPGSSERLLRKGDFVFSGAFTFPTDAFGDSSVNWTKGVIEVNGDSLFITGHERDDAIAEFRIPPLSPGRLANTGRPMQRFASVFDRLSANTENLDQLLGLEFVGGTLLLNAIEYYDGPADNRLTTIVIDNAANLAASAVRGPFALRGKARAAGWLSAVPNEWRSRLRCTHISGNSSGGPIIGRHSIGPSAFCVNLSDFIGARRNDTIDSRELLGFTLNYPLAGDLLNESKRNTLWTHISQATYGFVIPGTSTYATFGNSGGHNNGVGYKLKRSDGQECGGYCSNRPEDESSYFWLWDMRELLRVASGRRAPSEVKPYAWGQWTLPFSVPESARLGGASYDEARGLLYLSLLNTSYDAQRGTNPPIILVYSINN